MPKTLIACVLLLLASVAWSDVDYRQLVTRADLDYTTPATRSEEGQPLGNGRMGSLIWTTPSALHFQINRVDVFGEDSYTTSFPKQDSDYASGCAYVGINLSSGADDVFAGDSFNQHLSLYDATMTAKGKQVTTRVIASPSHDVFAIEIDDERDAPEAINIDLRMLRFAIQNITGKNYELAKSHAVEFHTAEQTTINRKTPHLGASKPAEFAPNATQVLLDRCNVNADNVWFCATGAGISGPIVLLNCTFHGNGRAESHQRWSTGMLYDNCRAEGGGLECRNRGSMGSGHGWSMGFAVMWNCTAKDFLIQNPPGALNWMIGCIGAATSSPRPFGSGPPLPGGTIDSMGTHVSPKSLYLTQLKERLGAGALKNIGYSSPDDISDDATPVSPAPQSRDLARNRPVLTSNVRGNQSEFFGASALDGDDNTYWATDDTITTATRELDFEGTVVNINTAEISEALAHRVQQFKLEAQVNSDWKEIARGSTIGQHHLIHFPTTPAWKFRLTILKSLPAPAIKQFSLYLEP